MDGGRERATSLLKFMTCGSVDDGKSSLIGRLLHECHAVFDDQLLALARDSRKYGTQGGDVDFALLLDGLEAEREQAITIDVAHRYFATPRRRFVVADTPGHEQYTRNMATAASTSDLAVLLVDASRGLSTQTRRHAYVVSMVGVRAIALAVNKMDLVGYDEARFRDIADGFRAWARALGVEDVACIPVSATRGDNVTTPSPAMPWYRGPALLPFLEDVEVTDGASSRSLRLPVQLVQRPSRDFRGYSGTIASGALRRGDAVTIMPSELRTRVARIVTADGDLERAGAGQAVTLTLADEIDVVRGDVIAAADDPAQRTDQFRAHVFWMHDVPMLPKRQYLFRIGHQSTTGQVTDLKHRLNVDTLERLAADRLALNEIGVCTIALDHPVAFDPFATHRATGCFVMIDRYTNDTVAGGTITFGLRRAAERPRSAPTVDRAARARVKGQRPCVVWFTGLSGAGKSTIANLVEAWLCGREQHAYLLDGDDLRRGLNRDLGFTDEDRVENVRRVAEVARLMADAGLIVLVSLISPFRAERERAREIASPVDFVEVHVDTPLQVCEARDPKGLYRRARSGQLPNFTGLDSPYELPDAPELTLPTAEASPDELASRVTRLLRARGIVD
jgi:bifunctional enzyme CysN/CysC